MRIFARKKSVTGKNTILEIGTWYVLTPSNFILSSIAQELQTKTALLNSD
jgi:hypothetical protein